MDFDSVASALGLSAPHEVWRPGFDESRSFAQQPDPEHLRNPDLWTNLCKRAGYSPELTELLWNAAQRCLALPAARRLLAHVRYCLFEKNPPADPTPWPMLTPETGDMGQLLYAMTFAAELPRTLAIHEQRGIPADITAHTLSDLELWVRHFKNRTGQWGFNEHGWIIKHMRGELFALGRLQFEMCANVLPFHVWQNADGALTIFADPNCQVRADGQFATAAGGATTGDTWLTTYSETDSEICGNPVDARGSIQHSLTRRPRDGWRKILSPQELSLSVHIPEAGPLLPDAVNDSFQQSQTFFPRYFPERTFHGYWIESWLMDPQLADYLAPESNIPRFQKHFHLVPFPHTNDLQLRQRVFGNDQFKPIHELPQKTQLQRIVIQHLQQGKHWRSMGGVRPFEASSPRRHGEEA